MLRTFMLLRFGAALIALISLGLQCASAADFSPNDEAGYATLLRTINPRLQQHQSMSYARSILADAQRSNLEPSLIIALVAVESSWRADAVSPDGARGLAQLMPSTAAHLGVNPRDPSQNLRGASRYLRSLLDRFAYRGVNALRFAIGAYNAGPLTVEHSGTDGTQTYIRRVLTIWHSLNGRLAKAFETPLAPASEPDAKLWLANAGASALPVSTAPAAADAASAPAAAPAPATAPEP